MEKKEDISILENLNKLTNESKEIDKQIKKLQSYQLERDLKKETKRIAKELEVPKPKINYKIKGKGKKKYYYIIPILNIFVVISVLVSFYFLKVGMIYTILAFFFGLPIFLLSLKFLFIRLFLDRKKIVGTIVKLVSKNFIIANFFKENKQILKVVRLLNKDGKSFDYNNGTYIVDMVAVWFDENKYPNSYYKEDVPNPLILKLDSPLLANTKSIIDKGIPLSEYEGYPLDVTYSSQNLQAFKKDKMLDEFHKDPSANKMLYAMMGLIALCILAIILIVIFKN